MLSITEDLVLGARFTIDKSGGVMLRLFEVSGLQPGVDTLAQAALAQDATTGLRMPAYGDPHPGVRGLFVNQIEADPVGNSRTSARVRVRYGPPEDTSVPNVITIAISGANRAKLISNDPNAGGASGGSPLVVKYTDANGAALQQLLQVPALSPNTVLQFTRQEAASPLRKSQRFRRRVNASPWQGGDAKTWLCRAIDATSLDNLARFEVKYIFEYDPDGWQHTEYYRDAYTGKIPDDVKASDNNDKGIAKVLPYATADFAQLALPNAY